MSPTAIIGQSVYILSRHTVQYRKNGALIEQLLQPGFTIETTQPVEVRIGRTRGLRVDSSNGERFFVAKKKFVLTEAGWQVLLTKDGLFPTSAEEAVARRCYGLVSEISGYGNYPPRLSERRHRRGMELFTPVFIAGTRSQRRYPLRELFNALCYVVRTGCTWRYLPHDLPQWARWRDARVIEALTDDLRQVLRLNKARSADPSAVIFDSRTLQSTPESGHRAGYDGTKRRKGSKVHIAVDTLGYLLTAVVTPANEEDLAQVGALVEEMQVASG